MMPRVTITGATKPPRWAPIDSDARTAKCWSTCPRAPCQPENRAAGFSGDSARPGTAAAIARLQPGMNASLMAAYQTSGQLGFRWSPSTLHNRGSACRVHDGGRPAV